MQSIKSRVLVISSDGTDSYIGECECRDCANECGVVDARVHA